MVVNWENGNGELKLGGELGYGFCPYKILGMFFRSEFNPKNGIKNLFKFVSD